MSLVDIMVKLTKEIMFILDGVTYSIRTESDVEDARQKANEYTRYLFDKVFIVEK